MIPRGTSWWIVPSLSTTKCAHVPGRIRRARAARPAPTSASRLLLHPRQQRQRSALRERLVEVPALRRLHARRAPRAAAALAYEAARVGHERLERAEADARDPDAA